ncbi:hypothetical protein V6N11_002619 [Hibiscus sabdariffa]|uniref:Nudix hydrolase domain-containing protein n=1 Tax=Hibiscus sabdariffa TaxID=183260 RepID=A0ABR2SAR2_9ROSI
MFFEDNDLAPLLVTRTFVGTNLNPSWEKFLVASEDDPTQCQHTSSPLGNGAIVETSDKKIVVLERSNNVGEFPGHFVFPGGHPEPQDVGIETHKYSKELKEDSELVSKKVSQEMFESTIREVVEEIGVPATSLSDPLFIGISRRVLNVRPAIFFFIKCSLESKEIHQLYSKAQDGYESTQLYTLSMNSFISYDALQKLGISQPIQYLQPRFPEGIPLVTVFVHHSMIEMLDAAIEGAIERGSWLDSVSLLPTSLGAQDASKILSLCPSVQSALKDVYDRVEKEMETLSHAGSSTVMLELAETVTESGNRKRGTEKGSKKKEGKSSGTKIASAEGDSENEDYIPTKSKKNQKKGKDTSSSQGADSRKVAKKDSIKAQEENVPSEEWLMQKLAALLPDFEEQGVDDPQTIIKYLSDYLRPKQINYWKERRKALFTENVEKMKHLLDAVQRKLDESFLNMQLYEKALDLFEDDQSTSVTLHRHLLRTVATSIADMLFYNLDIHNKLKNGTQVEDSENSESISLGPGERTAMAKSLPENQSKRALAVVEALEGKRVETFMTALRDLAEESGLFLKKLDKKLERTLLHSYRKDLTSQVSAETDPVSLLPKVVSLLYIQVHSRALQAPGRAISVAVTRLKDKLDDSAYKILTDFQTATVTLLAIFSAATGDEQDCSSDRITSKKELLESQMPVLKALVLGSAQA